MMSRTQTTIAVLLVSLLSIMTAPRTVQAAESPLTLWVVPPDTGQRAYKGDFWQVSCTEVPKQLTNWRYNITPILSPDGKWIAYNSFPTFTFPTLIGGYGGGSPPTNIWLLNIGTGNGVRIADQPADAATGGKNVTRSVPTWSPDSKFIAWGEAVSDGSNAPAKGRIAIYDVDTTATRFLPTDTNDGAGDAFLTPVWGTPGLIAPAFQIKPDSREYIRSYLFLPTDADTLESLSIPDDAPSETPVWIDTPEGAVIAEQWYTGDYFNPVTEEMISPDAVPELYSLTAPDGLRVHSEPSEGSETWRVTDSSGDVVFRINADLSAGSPFNSHKRLADVVGISPDGTSVRWIEDNTVQGTDDACELQLPPGDMAGILWGPTALRLRGE